MPRQISLGHGSQGCRAEPFLVGSGTQKLKYLETNLAAALGSGCKSNS